MISRNNNLASEIDRLERIISEIPEEDAIERAAFEERLEAVRDAFGQLAAVSVPERTRLTFRGTPVTGSQGIKADFGGRATLAFSEAFTAIVAGMKDNLKYMGPIPEKARTQLTVTGTVTGSFGFEFELPKLPDDYFPGVGGAGESLSNLFALLKTSAEGSDDEVADTVTEIHPRAVRKVTDFLTYLARNQAWCAIEFRSRVFRYRDLQHLRTSIKRLSRENIKEATETYIGEFQGVLPRQRTFEFKDQDTGEVLKGKVGPDFIDAGVLNREWLHKPVEVAFYVIQVGQGRPRYILRTIADIRRARLT
ncbi:hypothetical protein GOD68_26825 [Sinorhizobium medicae]|nr:hypothetical protein [Sinorhizobium medicae]MDX0672631.1 hypothetical protein [Sinorhizobium medicae]MDX0709832.1 hypothetical protein [Sinorhizobium medicae]